MEPIIIRIQNIKCVYYPNKKKDGNHNNTKKNGNKRSTDKQKPGHNIN